MGELSIFERNVKNIRGKPVTCVIEIRKKNKLSKIQYRKHSKFSVLFYIALISVFQKVSLCLKLALVLTRFKTAK